MLAVDTDSSHTLYSNVASLTLFKYRNLELKIVLYLKTDILGLLKVKIILSV